MTFAIGSLHFDFSNAWLLVFSAVLLVSLLLSSSAIHRRLIRRSAIRALVMLGINTLAYAAVLLILLEPTVRDPAGRPVVLITEGAGFGQSPASPAANVYVAPGLDATPANRRTLPAAQWLLDIGQLPLREPAISGLEVQGYGLDETQWRYLTGHPVVRFQPPGVKGFHAMRWRRQLTEGETMRITGRYGQADTDGVVELRLVDPAGNNAAAGHFRYGQPFVLQTRIKTRGNLEYKLQAWANGELESEQIVPLAADAGDRLDIMIVQSAPSYETRQLKDFAAARGHRMRLSTVVSQGKYIWQSANLPADAGTTLSPGVLADQDILIMDGRAFIELPAIHRQWIAAAVKEGLGLLLLADTSLLEGFGTNATAMLDGFVLTPLSGEQNGNLEIAIAGGGQEWRQPASVAAMRLEARDGDVLMAGEDDSSLVVRHASGLGHIGITLIRNSNGWLSAGLRSQWSDYWSLLLSELARQRNDNYLLPGPDAGFYRVGQRAALCTMLKDGEAVVEVTDTTSAGRQAALQLKTAPDTLQSSRHCAFFWPRAGGWHEAELQSATDGNTLDRQWFYVFTKDQWLAEQRARRINATRAFAAGAAPSVTTDNAAMVPLSRFWLWLTLILTASVLWLERKLDF